MNDEEVSVLFHEMGLDDRLLKSIATLGWAKPTLIQEKAIPLALEGKDILARARTGSGKTAAYCIPVIQKILLSKQTATEQVVRALILTPTKELCKQALKNIQELSSSCSRQIKCVDVSGLGSLDSQKPLLMDKPDIVIGTPLRILAHIQAKNLHLKASMEMLVIDEADLIFAFGYEQHVKDLMSHLPTIYQAFLMSATLGSDVTEMKKLVLHNPVILKLEESQLPDINQLTQYQIMVEECDKYVLMYALIKLNLISGKSIVFVNTVDKCYKLKLFLEQFGISSCVLNSELPVNSRCHIVEEFNNGVYSTIIAADVTAVNAITAVPDPATTSTSAPSGKPKRRKNDKEAGVSRGIDFQAVSNVINFDFPKDVDSYIHRVGRTARGDQTGTALSFVSIREQPDLAAVEEALIKANPEGRSMFQQYNFKMEEIDGFRYRANDALRAVTRIAVKEARQKEIKNQLLNSEKLKAYFEDNPRDLQVLRHDKQLRTVKQQAHLTNVPEYIVPQTLRHMGVRPRKSYRGHKGAKKGAKKNTLTKQQKAYKKRKADPLKGLEFIGFQSKKKKK